MLLATGYGGIVISLLRELPKEIEVAGWKFGNPELPRLTAAALSVAVLYFLIKFWSSYLYERSSRETEALAEQILEGKTAMDISREEAELNELSRHLIEQRKTLQLQQEHEEKRIQAIHDSIVEEDLSHGQALQITDQKVRDLEQGLVAFELQYPDERYLSQQAKLEKSRMGKNLEAVKKERSTFVQQRETTRQKDLEHLETEKANRKAMYEAQVRKVDTDEEKANDKREAILNWKRAYTTVGRVSPVHRFLELYLPIIVGLFGIISLIYLFLYFPPPANAPSSPEF